MGGAPVGKGKGGGHERVDDAIDIAAGTALFPISHMETTWDYDKLRWKVASYFRNAANSMTFAGDWEKLVNDFADTAFGQMVSALNDRTWMHQADFTLILDVAVKETFPPEILGQ